MGSKEKTTKRSAQERSVTSENAAQPSIDQNSNLENALNALSPRQKERMRAFQLLTNKVVFLQERINENESWGLFIFEEDGSKQSDEKGKDALMLMPQSSVDALREAGFHMYEGFQADPNMAAAANAHLEQLAALREQWTQRWNTIWEANPEEIL